MSKATPDGDVYVNGDIENQLDAHLITENHLLADASGGSDTDASKGDTSETQKDGHTKHSRSASIKKPTSFKPVSVTKNFLAKTATNTPTLRQGDKGKIWKKIIWEHTTYREIVTPSGQSGLSAGSAAKPRLIAKSVLSNSTPRSGASGVNGNGSGPDASKVWNKNRRIVTF